MTTTMIMKLELESSYVDTGYWNLEYHPFPILVSCLLPVVMKLDLEVVTSNHHSSSGTSSLIASRRLKTISMNPLAHFAPSKCLDINPL